MDKYRVRIKTIRDKEHTITCEAHTASQALMIAYNRKSLLASAITDAIIHRISEERNE